MNQKYLSLAILATYAIAGTANDPYIPERWADEALALLEENMVISSMVHRDFEDEIAEYGDVVNTRRPRDFQMNRTSDASNLTIQTPQSDNVRVPLDQWFSTAFIVKDGERSLSFQELVTKYVSPAAKTIAQGVDRSLLGRVPAFLANKSGRLGKITSANAGDFLLDIREQMTRNLAPLPGRNIILAPSAETAFLKSDMFIAADKRGDGGSALETATLGRIYGHGTYMGQNVNELTDANTELATGTVTNALASGGSGSQTTVITGYEAVVGEYAVVDGDDQPNVITARTASTNTTAVTLQNANKYGTLAGASIKVYKACDVVGDFAQGWAERIVVDGFAAGKGPQIGQILSFSTGVTRHTYTVIEAVQTTSTEYSILLDRPLDTAIANNDLAFPGPAGSLNLVFLRNALALVCRPLVLAGDGARSGVSSDRGLSIRVTSQYSIEKKGTIYHFDMLCGTAVLDTNLGGVLLG